MVWPDRFDYALWHIVAGFGIVVIYGVICGVVWVVRVIMGLSS